ncbi:MurR/RpiR family transcriptional regulator [Photobacterium atrarenae]|uniref:MurR/RpiR family transcriptional regulator n=1 Tax=Photobacterium atrarenae TaxID=865757 RepID=A0ABY5GNA5_9GAMM|nr:MurR/RpiR family transcriptional regulator [Photobacterium atrarenae]UTV30569.1 MurR/RpiR family transcriptional regulator [Photobacterium atrarenae]
MNHTKDVLASIRSVRNSLTVSSQRIADFILEHPEQIANLSTSELASSCAVGEASLIRFCKKMGFSGYQEFKMLLAVSLVKNETPQPGLLSSEIDLTDGMDIVAEKLQLVLQHVLSETRALLDFDILREVANSIAYSASTTFFGVGSSGVTAEEAKNKLMRIGLNVDAIANNHFMYMKASLLGEKDVVVAISHSGESPETIKALRIAKEAGAFTVALTHNSQSTICRYADKVLLNGNRENWLQGDSIGTKVAQVFVLDLLYTELVRADLDTAKRNKLKTTQSIM